eukprot:scaffold29961_cov65-Phaeocystis_antarctica.AAC.2
MGEEVNPEGFLVELLRDESVVLLAVPSATSGKAGGEASEGSSRALLSLPASLLISAFLLSDSSAHTAAKLSEPSCSSLPFHDSSPWRASRNSACLGPTSTVM